MSQRDWKNVLNKIQHIEKTFHDAHGFATSETGASTKEDNKGTFDDAVKRKCPHCFDLLPVMSDRASSKPKATSPDVDDDSGDLSDVSDEETGKSVGTKRTSATEATTSSKKLKRSNSKKKTSPIMDEEAIGALTAASKTSKEKMNELVRHHKFLQQLEEQKFELAKQQEASAAWKGKSDELGCKMQLLQRHDQLKGSNWSNEETLAFCPDMDQVIKARQNEWHLTFRSEDVPQSDT